MARKRLPRGWVEGTVQDLLGLSDDEVAIVEMRIRLAERVRERRRARGWTQRELAKRIQSTQPRVARLEQGEEHRNADSGSLRARYRRTEIGRLVAA